MSQPVPSVTTPCCRPKQTSSSAPFAHRRAGGPAPSVTAGAGAVCCTPGKAPKHKRWQRLAVSSGASVGEMPYHPAEAGGARAGGDGGQRERSPAWRDLCQLRAMPAPGCPLPCPGSLLPCPPRGWGTGMLPEELAAGRAGGRIRAGLTRRKLPAAPACGTQQAAQPLFSLH